MLSSVRVLDCSDHRGHLAGFILASLGAEVIDVEPPGGSLARCRGPVAASTGMSLEWWGLHRGRRAIALDDIGEYTPGADVLLESGAMALDLEALRADHPHLVTVSVSAFGATGPKAGWPASDLTITAAACAMALTGDADRAPVRTSVPQAWLHAGGEAACGALLALEQRRRSGLGQHVDVSAQIATMMAAIPGSLFVPNGNPPLGRIAGGVAYGPFRLQFVYPAADGHVSITFLFGDTIGPYTARLMQWVMEEDGDASLAHTDWVGFGLALFTDTTAPALLETAKSAIARFTATRSKAELFAEAQRRQLLLAPVATIGELLDDAHLKARGYWDVITDPDLGDVLCPGPVSRFSVGQRAVLGPPLGQRPAPRPPVALPIDRQRTAEVPLEGVKVLDLTWVYAGPLTTRVLADFGATVVKVEGPNRPDAARGGGGGLKGQLDPESSVQFGSINVDKHGVALDLTTAAGRSVLIDLVRWADVLVESYTPGVMAAWGLGWEQLRAVNPQLVMVSTSLMGQSGPLASFAGFGNLAGAITGFYELTGWADRSPAGPFLAYTDYLAPRMCLPAILAAMEWQRTHGEGVHVDFAQAEAAIHFLTPAVLEWTLNGVNQSRFGNADRFAAPHGVFPCRGEDRWVAIACESDGQWRQLAAVLGVQELASLSSAERLDRREEIDALVHTWAANRTEAEAEAALVAAGVPAHRVQNSGEVFDDPQLRHLDHWRTVAHPVHGSMVVEAARVRLARTPAEPKRAGPTLGEHTDHVLRGVLGYDDDQLAALALDGALG